VDTPVDRRWAAYGPLPSGPGAVTIAVDEGRRSRSYERLAEAIGRDEAVTIFELLPPPDTDLATRADLDEVCRRLDRIDDGLRDLRGEVVTAIAGQTRALVLGVLTATVSIGGLSVVFAQL
jgi:hypothetical protein